MKKLFTLTIFFFIAIQMHAAYMVLPMDEKQKNHLKAYGITYWVIDNGAEAFWLLNYRGGSFAFRHNIVFEKECKTRNVSFEVIPDAAFAKIQREISNPEVNQDVIKLEVAPKIAVYTPEFNARGERLQPWDDAVTLVLAYAEIPYETVYDPQVLDNKLAEYDWLHLHHEDFTGQYGKFYRMYHSYPWYKENVRAMEEMAKSLGHSKVSQMKLDVAKRVKEFVGGGGFMFAMCSATDTYDIALAAEGIDICDYMYDGDGADPNAQSKLDYSKTFAFKDFTLERSPMVYEFSSIDMTSKRKINKETDYFTLMDFSAKWDPIPTMLCQNHTALVKGFMGQTTAFTRDELKSNVLVLGENKTNGEAKYIHGIKGKGFFTFYGGHDPEDYQHRVGDSKTELDLHPTSPGYRLILNNVLFPAARKKKQKT